MRAQLDWILKNLSDPTQYIKETRVAIADTAPASLLRLQVEFNRKSKLSYWALENLIFPCTSLFRVGVFLKYQLLMQLLKIFLAGFIGITRTYTDLLGCPNIAFNTKSHVFCLINLAHGGSKTTALMKTERAQWLNEGFQLRAKAQVIASTLLNWSNDNCQKYTSMFFFFCF